jgi:hypothetical protein
MATNNSKNWWKPTNIFLIKKACKKSNYKIVIKIIPGSEWGALVTQTKNHKVKQNFDDEIRNFCKSYDN